MFLSFWRRLLLLQVVFVIQNNADENKTVLMTISLPGVTDHDTQADITPTYQTYFNVTWTSNVSGNHDTGTEDTDLQTDSSGSLVDSMTNYSTVVELTTNLAGNETPEMYLNGTDTNIIQNNTDSLTKTSGNINDSMTIVSTYNNLTTRNIIVEGITTALYGFENTVDKVIKIEKEYNPIEPYFTDDIEVSPQGHINSYKQHEFPVGTRVTLTCSGSIGSDRLSHKWHVATDGNPCEDVGAEVSMITFSTTVIKPDGCNARGESTTVLFVPYVTQPIAIWCWASRTSKTPQEECSQLKENSLMKYIVILPVAVTEVDPCEDISFRPSVLKPERTIYHLDEEFNISCSYSNGNQQHRWYFRRIRAEIWLPLPSVQEESEDVVSVTHHIPRVSLIHRGWYTCTLFECTGIISHQHDNQTFFLDVSYKSCRHNGVYVAGEGCIEVLSAKSCAAQNGTLASIHTAHKSSMVYGFAFHVLHIEVPVNLGLILTTSTLTWKSFLWTDGTSLTYREILNDPECIVCLETYPIFLAMGYKMAMGEITWVPALDDSQVACEWRLKSHHAGLSIPAGTSTYLGTKALFQCTSEEYISAVYVCDKTADCVDVSDELNCDHGCDGATFQCNFGDCIPASKTCDFIKDCADGSDELLCNLPPCQDGYWQCANKECIPVYDVCDGDVECVDGSDEAKELCIDNNALPTDYTFRCYEPDRALPLARKCDGVRDCSDKFGSDESSCSAGITYYSCLSWAVTENGINSSVVSVDYDMPYYGRLEVLCSIADWKVDTTWPFSQQQDIAIQYHTPSVSSAALWFETKWTEWQFQAINYLSPYQQKVMLSSSSTCVQYIRLCSYFVYIPGVVVEWTDGGGDIHSMTVDEYDGCTAYCIGPDKCSVYFTQDDAVTGPYFDGSEAFGWIAITNKQQLPIMAVRTSFVTVFGVSSLICSEDRHTLTTHHVSRSLHCKNHHSYDSSLRCLMNFDPTGEPIACRDLTHLEHCEDMTCPEHYVKCPGSFCLHMRYICDGVSHCPHREDELDCESTNCTNHYRCRTGSPCVPFPYLCDGERQCPLGDDESHCDDVCPDGCTCQTLTFHCDGESRDIYLKTIPKLARWINMKANMQNLTDHLPLSFPLLTTLILQSCSIDKLLVSDQSIFNNVTALRFLDVSSNKIQILSENVFRNLADLRTLMISYNPLRSISNKVFTGLKSLEILKISHSKISELNSDAFAGLQSLEHLDLSANFIGRLPGGVFSKLSSLQTLTLDGNPLVYIDTHALSRLYSLSSLHLSQIHSEMIASGVFRGLRALTFLNLSSSGIHNLGVGSFIDLTNLEVLDIQNTDIEAKELMFDGLRNLQYLYADSYKLCCIKPMSVLEENCFAPKDAISSCSNLIGSDFLRYCLWIIGLSALLGNIVVIVYRVIIDRNNFKKSHSIFVLNLTVSDFIMGVYLLIVASVDTQLSGRYVVNDRKWRQSSLCIVAGCLSVMSSQMSAFSILMITVDRFIAIVFPLSLRKISWNAALYVVALLWIISLMLAIIPQTMFRGYFRGEFYSRSGVCLALPLTGGHMPGQEYSVAVFIGLNGLMFLTILVLQTCIHRNCKDSSSINTTQNRKKEVALARSLFLVVATDFLCWFPIAVIGVWSQMGGSVSADVYAWVMVFVLPINSAVNPVLYTFINIRRRLGIRAAFKAGNPLMKLSRGTNSSSDGFNQSNRLKEIYFSTLFKTRPDSLSLENFSHNKKLSPRQAHQVASRIMEAVVFLHRRNVIHGNISDRTVHISNDKTRLVTRASLILDPFPIGGDHDSRTDILHYGILVKKLLRILDKY